MISLRGVTKRYGPRFALDDLTLDVPAGETTALIGPSGCGKSTLLRTVIGLVTPDAGQVTFDGTPVDPDSAPNLRRHMGYVIQDGGLFPHLTARENVTLMARWLGPERGWDDTRIEQRLDQLVHLTRFPEDGLSRYPCQLSGGQRQRVGLMRALVLDPAALLLDEPLGALDPMIRVDLQAELKQIFADLGKTVLLVTHDLDEAAYLGHQSVLLRDGRVVQRGTAADLIHAPADEFVTRFVRAQHRGLAAEPGPDASGRGGPA